MAFISSRQETGDSGLLLRSDEAVLIGSVILGENVSILRARSCAPTRSHHHRRRARAGRFVLHTDPARRWSRQA